MRFSVMLSTVALVAALSGVGGAFAGSAFIGSKQIRNGSIKSVDLKNGGVQSTDVANGSIGSADVKNDAINSPDLAPGAVEEQALDLPVPTQCDVNGEARVTKVAEFAKVADLCTYNKSTAESVLEVDWTGAVAAYASGEYSGCVFQVRVNDAPAAQGGGDVFLKGLTQGSASVFFSGLPAGPVTVSIWAKEAVAPGFEPENNYCALGSAAAGGVGQTVSVSEQVV